MTDKLRRMQTILVVAALLIFVADISLFISTLISQDIIKILIGLIIPTSLLFLSLQVEKGLKLEKCSLIVYNISMATYMASFVGALNILLDGAPTFTLGAFTFSNVLLVSLFGLFLSGLSFAIQKKNIFIKIGYVCFLIALGSFIPGILSKTKETIRVAEIITMLIISTIVLISNLIFRKEYTTFLTVLNGVVLFASISVTGNKLAHIFLILLSIVTFTINIRKQEIPALDSISFIGIILSIIAISADIEDVLGEGATVLISIALISIIDMLFCVLDIGKNRKQAFVFKFILDGLVLFYMIISISSNTEIIPMVILVLFSSIVSTYALQSDKYEQYMLPFKIILSLVGLIEIIALHITISFMIALIAINIASILGSMISNNKLFKILFTVSTIVTLLLSPFAVEAVFDYFVVLIMLLIDYYLLFIADHNIQNMEPVFFIITSIISVSRLDIFEMKELYLVAGIIFAIIHFMRKDKTLKNIAWIMAGVCANIFLALVTPEYDLYGVSLVLVNFVLFEYLFYINESGEAATILLMSILGFITLVSDSMAAALVYLMELFALLFLSYKNSQSLFRATIVLIVLTIIAILLKLDAVPTFVYMLLIGFLVIYLIYKSIKKYMDNEYKKEISQKEKKKDFEKVLEENKDYIYCSNCGTRLPKDAKFCNECGNKLTK